MELKNDLCITGTLHSVDQYMNIKINNIRLSNPEKYPHMASVVNCFVRGSVVRYVVVRGVGTGRPRAVYGGTCLCMLALSYASEESGALGATMRIQSWHHEHSMIVPRLA